MMTDALAQDVLERVFSGPVGVALYVAGVEVMGEGYARQSATFAVNKCLAVNTSEVAFPPAGTEWGVVDEVGLFSGDMKVFHGPLDEEQRVFRRDVVVFRPGELAVTLPGG